ncbi:MAG TPA: serine/threonine-protein kinase [Kofleriaceae bacterium]
MIQVGQVLDKYELLERVGQGGMAIVYRGIDRTLKRVVAIKVLHKHLSDYQEARDRFEREAQAVAKLRHENILEIFDYSAKAGAESYIVTEFIDGQTLKQFITDRPIGFPEVGAMIMLQVARALAHAHAGGILHRDVKPENIMIRSDGVVKLMDFGISHMVDLERLTVTGQLLGSPAYMAPEHVEGRQLDFRTDVFAVGIVLYQLTVGKLPFEGKNPHEVLKRIAECKFVDPRQANPRIGNRLGKIILRAMAAQPADRYPAISEMVIALEAYLEESGIAPDKLTSELARYFKAPASYEQALKERLVDHLSRLGQKLLSAGDQTQALDVFDRVLTIDPENAKVLAILDSLNRRARLKHASLAIAAASVIALGGYMIHKRSLPPEPDEPPTFDTVSSGFAAPATHVAGVEPAPDEVVPDAAVAVVVTSPADASRVAIAPTIDAGQTIIGKPLRVIVNPAKGSLVKFGDEEWSKVTEVGDVVHTIEHDMRISAKNDCCEEAARDIRFGVDSEITFSLQPLPAKVVAKCDQPGDISVRINGKASKLNEIVSEPFEKNTTQMTKTFEVSFAGGIKQPNGELKQTVSSKPQTIVVRANELKDAKCDPP